MSVFARFRISVSRCVTAVLCLLMAMTAAVTAGTADRVYTIGFVPQFEQRRLFSIWKPILDDLTERTGYQFEIKGTPKIPEFENRFLAGEFDFAYANPYHALMAYDAQGYVPIVKDVARQLFGILVVPADSPIQSVEELQGARIAFPAPNALGASLLMRADLANLVGIQFEPVYVKTHSSVYLHAFKGLSDISAGGGVMGTLRQQDKAMQDGLRILYKTRPMARHPLIAHPRVPEKVREDVRRAFLELAATPDGQKLIAKIPMKEAGPASIEDYAPMRDWGLGEFYVSG